jgi:hypothetical protein
MPWSHAPLLIESFSKTPKTCTEASTFSGFHNYNTIQNKTKQNKLRPSFIDGKASRIFLQFLKGPLPLVGYNFFHKRGWCNQNVGWMKFLLIEDI